MLESPAMVFVSQMYAVSGTDTLANLAKIADNRRSFRSLNLSAGHLFFFFFFVFSFLWLFNLIQLDNNSHEKYAGFSRKILSTSDNSTVKVCTLKVELAFKVLSHKMKNMCVELYGVQINSFDS